MPEVSSQIEVPAMSTHMIKIDTKDHQGPLQLTLDFIERFKGDIKISINTHAKVNSDDYLKQYIDKKMIVLRPVMMIDNRLAIKP